MKKVAYIFDNVKIVNCGVDSQQRYIDTDNSIGEERAYIKACKFAPENTRPKLNHISNYIL